MRPSQLLSAFLLSSTVSAWSLSDLLVDNKAIQRVEGVFRRQDNSDNSDSTTTNKSPASTTQQAASSAKSSQNNESGKETAAKSTDDAKSTGDAKATTTNAKSDSNSDSDSKTTSGGGKSDSSAKSTGSITDKASATSKVIPINTKSYNASVGYGGVSMMTPNPASSASYYKVGNYITFAWNMTSLSVTPTAVDVIASCTANKVTYTLATNQSVTASTGSFTWDTGAYQASATIPLLTETYTLIIHDADIDPTATVAYGHLAPFSAFKFAMYTKQAYTGLSDGWKCVTCSGAVSLAEKQTMGFMFAMASITVLSFTWFAGSFGVF